MNNLRMYAVSTLTAASLLAWSTIATAQAGAGKPAAAATTPSNAELQQEVEALREQVRQLQQAQKATPADKHAATGCQGDKSKCGKDKGMAMGQRGKQKGMGMMDMDQSMEPTEKDDSMPMPPADSKSSGSMPSHM